MTLPRLNLIPAQAGYSVSDADDAVLRAKTSGGPSRTRLDVPNAPAQVTAAFQMDGGEFQYWRAFFNTTIAQGALPFIIGLMIDYADLADYEVKIIGPTRLSSQSGNLYSVQMQLEVRVIARDTDYDNAIVMLYGNYGDSSDLILFDLEKLVNVDLPMDM